MDPIRLKEQLAANGIALQCIHETKPGLFMELSYLWERTLAFRHKADRLFMDQSYDLDGQEIKDIQLLMKVHRIYSAKKAQKADPAILKALSDTRLMEIERDQMPLTSVMAEKMREAYQKIGMDDQKGIQLLKDFGIDLNQKDRDGLTASAIAAQSGAEKCLMALCQGGANPHVADSMGNTSLHWAAAMGKVKAAQILLYFGAAPNAVNHTGVSPLMLALARADGELSQRLMDYGADLRLKDRRGNTALHRAIQQKNKEAVRLLLECGAPTDEMNMDGLTPKTLAWRTPGMGDIGDMFGKADDKSRRAFA